jgi:hypothetical protein
MDVFFDHLINEQRRISSILSKKSEMLPLTDEELQRFDRTRSCPKCNQDFSDENKKVMHHNHRTGQFIDAACNSCNLQIKSIDSKFFIPVVFHNLKITMLITYSDVSVGVWRSNTTEKDLNRATT